MINNFSCDTRILTITIKIIFLHQQKLEYLDTKINFKYSTNSNPFDNIYKKQTLNYVKINLKNMNTAGQLTNLTHLQIQRCVSDSFFYIFLFIFYFQ